MTITGHTRVFMIVGDPIVQVKAPEVYNHLFNRHGIDAVVVPAKVAPERLADFVTQVFAAQQNLGGLWVTIPHKAAMQTLMARNDAVAQIAGAVNAVRRGADGALEGALFDGLGFVKGLDQFGIPVAGRRVLVVGAGGGGQAVAAALAQRGPAELAIANRGAPRRDALVARLTAAFGPGVRAAASSDPAGFDLIVNCSSLGLKADDPLPFDAARVDAEAAVVDIIMKATPLQQACAARGLTVHAGYEMLVQQVPEYLRFMGYAELAQTLQQDLAEVRALLAPR